MNVNEASQEELESLPGVGPATAEKLMKARPIADRKELEGVIPPSAWLKIQEEGVEFAFGAADRDPPDNEVRGPQPEGEFKKFRKRPVVVEAYRTGEMLAIETLEGTMTANPGDWIIRGVKGELYPCKPDIFGATYTPVGDGIPISEPVVKTEGPQPMVLKRLMPGQRLRAGAEYVCLWNMRFGPQNEAWIPEDAPREVATEEWFNNEVRNKVGPMAIKFAHWGPSVQIQSIPGLGVVNLLLFEIIKEEKKVNGNGSRNGEGN